MNIKFSTIVLFFIAVIAISFSSCKPEEVELVPTSFSIISGDNQTAEVETALPSSIEIFVKDQNGNGLEGVKVDFSVTEGSVSTESKTTESNGKTTIDWTLGTTEGIQTLTIIVYKTDGTTALTGSSFSVNATATYKTTVTDVDGNTYGVVQIGEQFWTTENLKTIHYSNGEAIELVEDNDTWANLGDNDKAYSFYDNNEIENYGALYTWTAATNGESSDANPSNVQGICPDGWHIPSELEWKELADYLGGIEVAGKKLRGGSDWSLPNSGAPDEVMFTALPTGYRQPDGVFRDITESVNWWTTTEDNEEKIVLSWIPSGNTDNLNIWNGEPKKSGNSIRCIKN